MVTKCTINSIACPLLVIIAIIDQHCVMGENATCDAINIDFSCLTKLPSIDVLYNDHYVTRNENLRLSTYYPCQPVVRFDKAKKNSTYTLVMVDPDAPGSKNTGTYYLHWIVSNIPGRDFRTGELKDSDTLIYYAPPRPPKGTGIHRYQFLVFEQPPQTGISTFGTGRAMFNLVHFLRNNKFKCSVVAFNQFRAHC